LRQGRQALVLLPERTDGGIFDTVEARFGCKPAEWHSGVTMTERRRCWRMVGQGDAQLIVGALGLIFTVSRSGAGRRDEEHDTSYKQEDGVLYNAQTVLVRVTERSCRWYCIRHTVVGILGKRRSW
jgi:primosomal protein N' (replication factor Y)